MDALGTGLILTANGLLDLLGRVADPMTLIGATLLASAFWLATIEIEELDRQGAKPQVGRH
jgi:hypothetical protein